MLDRIKTVKQKMNESLAQLCDVSWMFSKRPGKNFTRDRKLPFAKVVSFMDDEKDSLRFYYLGNQYEKKIEHFGRKDAYRPEELLMI